MSNKNEHFFEWLPWSPFSRNGWGILFISTRKNNKIFPIYFFIFFISKCNRLSW